jgi:acyl carrier protein
MEDRIYKVVSEVFGIPVEDINDNSSPDTIPTWESLAHINLILSLESEFNLSLSLEDGMEMLSVGLIKTILGEVESTGTE